MFRKGIIVIVLLLFPVWSQAQSREKKALKLIKNQRFNSAFVLLKKSLAKDSLDLGAFFVLAQYYTIPQNADFQLDSAYVNINKAIELWPDEPSNSRRKLRKLPLDSVELLKWRREIEEKAFDEVKKVNTEEAYNKFLSFYIHAGERPAAQELMEKVAFEKAVLQNTHSAFLDYITRFPGSRYQTDAQEKYDRLLFESSTTDKSLEAYSKYLSENPQSPYRHEVEQNIFEIATAEGSANAFQNFIQKNPDSSLKSRATAMLSYLLKEDRRDEASATSPVAQDTTFLVPVLVKGKFGFMSPGGKMVIQPSYEELSEDYTCGNVQDDVIVVANELLSNTGIPIYSGAVSSMEDLGYGFILAGKEEGSIVLHKSGFMLKEGELQDAKLLQGKLFALKKNGLWGLFTLAGRKLLNYECQEISAIGNVFILKINDKYTLSTLSSLAGIANAQKGKFTDAYDDVKKSFDENIWIKTGKFEAVLSQDLEILVKADTHQISPTYFGAVAASAHGFSTFNKFGEESEYFERINVVKPWVAGKSKSGWLLFDPEQRMSKSIPYDSIVIHGPFAVGMKKDGIEVHLHKKPSSALYLPLPDKIELLPAQDSTSYLMLQYGKKMEVYGPSGEKLFTVSYDKIQSAGQGFFIVSKKEKKGLVNVKGKTVLQIDYDAIGNTQKGYISVLKGGKFGLYNYTGGKLIKAEYEKNIVPYGSNFFWVFKDGLAGFIDDNNKAVSKIQFNEILPWTDSAAWVKDSNSWKLFNLYEKNFTLDDVTDHKSIKDAPDEKILIIRQKGQAGVVSNRHGVIIPVNFTDIVNVGSPDVPVYFTEKHVPEASIFVVIYYDHSGNFLRKEVYEQEDYERIYCNK